MNKKITSLVLTVAMLLSIVTVGSFSTQAVTVESESVSADVSSDSAGTTDGLADSIQDGQILQCWNWSYNGIKNNMAKIAEQGFTAIQTNPIQTIKESTQGKTMQGSWWVYYQPSNFSIDTSSQNALGTKAEFKAMCEEAHKYGVKVVVDAVLNHMANKGDNTLSDTIPSDIKNDSNCWHSITTNTSNWSSRWDITHNCMGGLPDLNTGNSKIQNYEIAFLKECIDCGVDGFRFDGAKHIEVPSDYENASSNFWSNVLGQASSYAKSTNGTDLYYYGEILDGTGGGQTIVNQYTNYMSVTVNSTSNDIRNKVNSGNASGAARSDLSYSDGSSVSGSKAVLWNESHDTYADGASRGQSDTTMKKTWALVGSRAQAVGLYLARPSSYSNSIGTASVTAWGDTEVAAVNHFRNYFTGETEYLASSGSIAYNERGTEGVVLVNLSGNSTSVSVTANKMASGTYTDQITGNTFTVSGGKISGTIGSTGIAVVYNAKPAGPSATITPGTSSYKTDTLSLKVAYNSTATSAQYSIDGGAYTSVADGGTITIGSGLDYGTKTTVSIKASDGSTTSDPTTYTYTKVDPSAVQMAYFDNSSYNWSSVYAYIYSDTTNNGAWPGTKMTLDSSTGYYAIEIPEDFANGYVIFTESSSASTNRYPADMQPGLELGGTSMLFKANHEWVEYSVTPTTQPTTASQTTEPTESTQSTTASQTTEPTESTQSTTPSQPTEKILIGDANFDGDITIRDAALIQRYISNLITISDNLDKFLIAADVSGDGRITILDAAMIQRYIAHEYSSSGKCGEYYEIESPTTAPTTVQTEPTETTSTTQPTTATQATTQAGEYTITFTNNKSWSSVNCYYWSDSDTKMTTWPGKAMTYSTTNDYGEKIYTITIPSTATYIIFNDGNGSQTVDISVTGSAKYYISGGSGTSYTVKTWQ